MADDPRRGQLDRQRDTVEPAAQVTDGGAVRRVDCERGIHRTRAIDEQASGITPHDGLEVVGRVGSGERPQRPHLLALDRKPLTARRQDAHARRVAQHRGDEPGRRVEQMLAVVEDQEQALGAEELDDAILDRGAGAVVDAERERDDLDHRLGVTRDRELAEPRAIRMVWHDLGRDLDRQAGLADAADTRQRHQARLLERAGDRRELVVTPHERIDLWWKVARERIEDWSRGNSRTSSGCTSWKMRSGRARPRRRCSPRSTS